MAKTFLTSDLIEKVKRYASVPTAQPLFNTQAFIDMLNEELIDVIVPTITACREDYFIDKEDYTIVRDQYGYRIPTRAIGMKVDRVQRVDPNSASDPVEYTRMGRISPNELDMSSTGWWFENNKIMLIGPNNHVGQTLRVYYERRPGYLIDEASAGQIASIDSTTQLTLTSVPSTWVSGTTTFDLIQQKPPFDTLAMDQAATIASLVLTFTDTLPTDLAVGDWIGEATCSPIAQIPLEFQNLLCQGAAIKCLEALGDTNNIQIAMTKYGQMEQKAVQQTTPRANKGPKFLRNRYSLIHDRSPSVYI